MHHPTTNPTRCIRWSKRVVWTTAPLALLTLLSWGFHWHQPLHIRPHLVMMIYMALLLAAMSAVCVGVLGSCHLAINRAFSVGVGTGRQMAAVESQAHEPHGPARRGSVSHLHAVDRTT